MFRLNVCTAIHPIVAAHCARVEQQCIANHKLRNGYAKETRCGDELLNTIFCMINNRFVQFNAVIDASFT
jgi:hypothetical protein